MQSRPRQASSSTASTSRLRTMAQVWAKVWPMLAKGAAGPEIFRVFPLAEAAAAHRLMESSEHIGKIMLKVAD